MNTQRGSDSYLLFALNKSNAPDTPISDLNDVDRIVYNIVSADLARDTEVVTIEESSASGNPQVPEAGRIRTQGNVVYNLRGQNMQRILQHALWTSTPVENSITTTKILRAASAFTADQTEDVTTQPGADIEPARAKITFAGATGAGSVDIVGTDMDDLEINDNVKVTAANVNGVHLSTEYFKTIKTVRVNSVTPGTLALEVDNGRKEVKLVPGNTPLFGTLELNRGLNAPNLYDRLMATGFAVAVTGNGSVQLTVNYAGRTTQKKRIESVPRNDSGLHGLPVAFKEVNDSVFLAYGTIVTFGGVVLPIRDMNLNVNQNYDVQGYLTGKRPYATPEQNSRVTAVLTGTVKYAYNETFTDTFIQNRFVEDFSLKLLRAPSGKPKDETEFKFGRGKLSADPDRMSVSQGVVEQPIEISLLGSEGATKADYLSVILRSLEGLYGSVFTPT